MVVTPHPYLGEKQRKEYELVPLNGALETRGHQDILVSAAAGFHAQSANM
jgi:hypothetical protein